MSKYKLRFWFEHGGICIWGKNEKTKEIFGYAIESEKLPISEVLLNELNALEEEYGTALNWDSPGDPSPWTKEQKSDFLFKANDAYRKLQLELGSDFEIINAIEQSIY